MSGLGPWKIYALGQPTLSAPTLALAKSTADKVYPRGSEIEHETTGELWRRSVGGWSQRRGPMFGHQPAAPEPEGAAC